MNNVEILNCLLSHQPVKTADLPRDQRGIYGLIDHTGHLRYWPAAGFMDIELRCSS